MPDSYLEFVKNQYMNLPGARIVVTGKPHVVNDVQLDPAYGGLHERYAQWGFRGMVLFPQRRSARGAPIGPIVAGQPARTELLGVLGLYHREPVWLPKGTLALATLFAEQVALAICNFRLFRDREHLVREAVLGRTQEIVGPLAAGIAHDLNNVFGVVLGVAHLLPRADAQPRQELLGQLVQQVEHGAGLTRSLLDLSRVGSAASRAEPPSCDLALTARQAVEVVRTAAHPDTTIVVEAPEGGCWARIEPVALSRILLNLLLNAVQAIGSRRQKGRIAIRVSVTGDLCAAEVDDNGPGVREEVAARIFEPFVSFDKLAGAGVGLASARALAEQAGGTLALRHRPGPGACFVVELPRRAHGAAAEGVGTAVPQPPPQGKDPPRPTRPARLLLAEDEPVQRRVFAGALRAAGLDVVEAATGGEAEALVARGTFDLLVLDQRMPGMTGSEVLQSARAGGARMPVLMVSGYNVDARAGAGLEGVRMVSKPLSGEALVAHVLEILGTTGPHSSQ